MKFSIIIPTANRNNFLQNCLEKLDYNVQELSRKDYEIIITDDGKENQAKELIKEKFPWAQWVEGPKRGPAANRNNAAKYARGEWLIFLDDDCEPEQDIIIQYQKTISQNHSEVVEGCIYSDSKILPLYIAPVNLKGGNLWSCNFAIKKHLFEELKGFDENYKYPNLEDNDLHRRIKQKGYLIPFAQDAKVYHPPRLAASPKKLALYHESWLYYHKKFGEQKTIKDLFITIIRTRIRSILLQPKNLNTITVTVNVFKELFYTYLNSRKWNIK